MSFTLLRKSKNNRFVFILNASFLKILHQTSPPKTSLTAVRPLNMTSFTETPSYEEPARDSDRLVFLMKLRMDSEGEKKNFF